MGQPSDTSVFALGDRPVVAHRVAPSLPDYFSHCLKNHIDTNQPQHTDFQRRIEGMFSRLPDWAQTLLVHNNVDIHIGYLKDFQTGGTLGRMPRRTRGDYNNAVIRVRAMNDKPGQSKWVLAHEVGHCLDDILSVHYCDFEHIMRGHYFSDVDEGWTRALDADRALYEKDKPAATLGEWYRDVFTHLNRRKHGAHRDRGPYIYESRSHAKEAFAKLSEYYFYLRDQMLCEAIDAKRPLPTEDAMDETIDAALRPLYPHLWPRYHDVIIPKLRQAATLTQDTGVTVKRIVDLKLDAWKDKAFDALQDQIRAHSVQLAQQHPGVRIPDDHYLSHVILHEHAYDIPPMLAWAVTQDQNGNPSPVDMLLHLYGEADATPDDRRIIESLLAGNANLREQANDFAQHTSRILQEQGIEGLIDRFERLHHVVMTEIETLHSTQAQHGIR